VITRLIAGAGGVALRGALALDTKAFNVTILTADGGDLIPQARGAGRRRVLLDTETTMTAARRLYERLGFRREPGHDWSPVPGMLLLGYVLELAETDGRR